MKEDEIVDKIKTWHKVGSVQTSNIHLINLEKIFFQLLFRSDSIRWTYIKNYTILSQE